MPLLHAEFYQKSEIFIFQSAQFQWEIGPSNIVENNIFNKILNSTYYKKTILQALTKLYIMCIDGRVSA